MTLEEFSDALRGKNDNEELEEFTREVMLHGTPFVFFGRDAEYYKFKLRICKHLGVHHTEIFLVGSGKLGFSPFKNTDFSLDSDIDLAIVSPNLWERVFSLGMDVEYARRSTHITFHNKQAEIYKRYLRYMAIGWARPDLMPRKLKMEEFKDDWFNFFKSISHDNSEVGNYKVNAGVFRGQDYLEKYSFDSMRQIQRNLLLPERARQ